jgi:ribosomal protein S18 acetylase RimI-like enzyme
MEPADVVLRFLASAGSAEEAEFYLSLFRSEPKERFGLLHVDANVVRGAADTVVMELGFLASLGLTPAVALGLFAPAEAAEHAASLRRKLEAAQVPAAIVASEDEAVASARRGVIPLVVLGGDDRVARLGAFLRAMSSRQLIFLARAGGLRVKGQLVTLVNLSTDVDALAGARELTRKEQAILAAARRLVFDLVPHKLLVAVTSPLDLLRELFTVKGAGTLMRRGAVILRRRGLATVDRDRLAALLASSFGQPPAEGFFDRAISDVYLEDGYRGAAILMDTPLGPYLSKFAVEREAQGEGLGRDVWEALVADYPRFFWRARASNPIGAWYTRVCDGLARFPEWNVYWRGLPAADLPAAIEWALAAPRDFA